MTRPQSGQDTGDSRTKVQATREGHLASGPTVVVALAFLHSLLALFQWMELLVVDAGGQAICTINQTVDCARIWSSSFAVAVDIATGLPIAGWGLVWGVAVVAQGLVLVHGRLRGAATAWIEHALRLSILVGAMAVATLAAVSISAGAACPTCLATYVLVAALGYAVLRLLPAPLRPSFAEGRRAVALSVGTTALPFVLALWATQVHGLKPRGGSAHLASGHAVAT